MSEKKQRLLLRNSQPHAPPRPSLNLSSALLYYAHSTQQKKAEQVSEKKNNTCLFAIATRARARFPP